MAEMPTGWRQPLSSIPRQSVEPSMSVDPSRDFQSLPQHQPSESAERDDARRIIHEVVSRELASSSTNNNNNSNTNANNNDRSLSSQFLNNSSYSRSESQQHQQQQQQQHHHSIPARSPIPGVAPPRDLGLTPSKLEEPQQTIIMPPSHNGPSVRGVVAPMVSAGAGSGGGGGNYQQHNNSRTLLSSNNNFSPSTSMRSANIMQPASSLGPAGSGTIVGLGGAYSPTRRTYVIQTTDGSLDAVSPPPQTLQSYDTGASVQTQQVQKPLSDLPRSEDYFTTELLRAGAATPDKKDNTDPYSRYQPQQQQQDTTRSINALDMSSLVSGRGSGTGDGDDNVSPSVRRPPAVEAAAALENFSSSSTLADNVAPPPPARNSPRRTLVIESPSLADEASTRRLAESLLTPVSAHSPVPTVLPTARITSMSHHHHARASASSNSRMGTPPSLSEQRTRNSADYQQRQPSNAVNNNYSGRRTNSPQLVRPIAANAQPRLTPEELKRQREEEVRALQKQHQTTSSSSSSVMVEPPSTATSTRNNNNNNNNNNSRSNSVVATPATSAIYRDPQEQEAHRQRSPRTEAEVVELRKKVEQLTHDIEECFTQSTQSENALHAEIRELKTRDAAREERIKALEELLENARNERHDMSQRAADFQGRYEHERDTVQSLRGQLAERETENRALSEKLVESEGVLSKLSSQIQSHSQHSPSGGSRSVSNNLAGGGGGGFLGAVMANNSSYSGNHRTTTIPHHQQPPPRDVSPPASSDAADSWEQEDWGASPFAAQVASSLEQPTAMSPSTRAFEERLRASNHDRRVARERAQKQEVIAAGGLFSPPAPPRLQPRSGSENNNSNMSLSQHPSRSGSAQVPPRDLSCDSPPRAISNSNNNTAKVPFTASSNVSGTTYLKLNTMASSAGSRPATPDQLNSTPRGGGASSSTTPAAAAAAAVAGVPSSSASPAAPTTSSSSATKQPSLSAASSKTNTPVKKVATSEAKTTKIPAAVAATTSSGTWKRDQAATVWLRG